MSRYVSFGVLLAVIAVLSILFYKILAGFLIPMFLAALLVVVFRPLHEWVVNKCRSRQKIAALLTTLAIMLVVLVPLSVLLTLAILEGREAATKFNSGTFGPKLIGLRRSFGLETPYAAPIRGVEANFDEMRKTWGSQDVEYHQELWGFIGQFTRQIDQRLIDQRLVQEESKPAVQDQEPGTKEAEQEEESTLLEKQWKRFKENQEVASRLRLELVQDIQSQALDATQDSQLDILQELTDYHEKINETSSNFTDFKNNLLGGRLLAAIKMAVNPGTDEVAAYSDTLVDFFESKLLALGGVTTAFALNLLIGGAIMVISLYFFLLDGPSMIKTFQGLSPLDDLHEQELVDEFSNVSRAVVVAILLSALVQGLLAGIGFYFCGFDSIFLLILLTSALALVPFVGAASVWVPAALYLFFIDNNIPAAIGLAVYGIAVISMADNIIKPFILHGQSNIHPLLALLSILGGVSALGPVGLLVGPMVVAFLQTLLKILQRELSSMDRDEAAQQQASSS